MTPSTAGLSFTPSGRSQSMVARPIKAVRSSGAVPPLPHLASRSRPARQTPAHVARATTATSPLRRATRAPMKEEAMAQAAATARRATRRAWRRHRITTARAAAGTGPSTSRVRSGLAAAIPTDSTPTATAWDAPHKGGSGGGVGARRWVVSLSEDSLSIVYTYGRVGSLPLLLSTLYRLYSAT